MVDPPVGPAPDGGESSATITARLPLLNGGKKLKPKRTHNRFGDPREERVLTREGDGHWPLRPAPCQTMEKPYLAKKQKFKEKTTPFLRHFGRSTSTASASTFSFCLLSGAAARGATDSAVGVVREPRGAGDVAMPLVH